MDTARSEWLYARCLDGTASSDERKELLVWLALPDNEQLAKSWLLSVISENDERHQLSDATTDALLEAIFHTQQAPVIKMRHRRKWLSYAAAITIVAGICIWLLNKQQPSNNNSAVAQKEVAPARQGAILTLADGQQLVLDSLKNGVVAVQNGVKISLKNGKLIYSGSPDTLSVVNTISTPKGRKCDVVLSDGTHIWLNAASSLTYPAVFARSDRRVTITGEAYMEVTKDPQRPFIVDVERGSTVQVLGTSFNIKAYQDEENIQTSLLEGSIKLDKYVLNPGEQAIQRDQQITVLKNVEMEPVLAWKNGIFNFNDADLQTVMRELSRWYDMEVIYRGVVPKRRFKGEIGRDLTLTQVLKGLKQMDVHFNIEGNKIIVTE